MLRVVLLAISATLLSQAALALNYNELEVYGYQTASPHEVELENTSSISSGNDKADFTEGIARTSFEGTFGLTENWESAFYVDAVRIPEENLKYTGFRARARTHFFEQGELPVDMGAYFEAELPQDPDKDWALESRLILAKDFGRILLALNPAIEMNRERPDADSDKKTSAEFHLGASFAYNVNDFFRPHLDLLSEFTAEPTHLLLAQSDFNFRKFFKAGIGAGMGLTGFTEKRLVTARLEYEF